MHQSLSRAHSEQARAEIEALPKEVREFYYFHGVQMVGSDFPTSLIQRLRDKLIKSVYDAGDVFEAVDNQNEECFQVTAKKDLPANGDVFIIDHALTFRYPDLHKNLLANPKIIDRLEAMLKYTDKPWKREIPETNPQQPKPQNNFEIEMDGCNISELAGMNFPQNILTLSLVSNNLSSVDDLTQKLTYMNLKALWINDNPILEKEEDKIQLEEYIFTSTKIEIYNGKFTPNCGVWGILYAQKRDLNEASASVIEAYKVLNLDGRSVSRVEISIMAKFTNLRALSIKDEEFTTQVELNYLIQLLIQLEKLNFLEVGPKTEQLLFELFSSNKIPKEVGERVLINKRSLLLPFGSVIDQRIGNIAEKIFKLCGNYRLASSEKLDETSTWYMNDELGSMISHSDSPNMRLMPFLFAADNQQGPQMCAFSLLWPIKPIKKGQLIARDYLNNMGENKQRSHRYAAWFEVPNAKYLQIHEQYSKRIYQLTLGTVGILETFYRENAEKQKQFYNKMMECPPPSELTVITDHEIVRKNLTNKAFKFVDKLQDAQLVWLVGPIDEEPWKKFRGKFLVNQLPYESAVVMKQNLAKTITDVFGQSKYLMPTYNLQLQLAEFIGEYVARREHGQDNLWILKPPNMARSMDMMITDNLSTIIRSMETGPRIAQKYITNPVLRKGSKVDLRYIIAVRSIHPLTIYLYKHFWIRSSNNPYTVDRRQLSTYETQFTVMNYGAVSAFKQIKYTDFIEEFEKDYAPQKWSGIHEKIKTMLRNVFVAAGRLYPQMHDDYCRAIYGVDIMIDASTIEPKLLEITFSPDCKRACQYYPTFYNEVFETLYLDEPSQNMERVI